MLGKIVIGVLLLTVCVYGGFEALPLVLGPALSIDSPADFASVPGGIVAISGHVARTTALTLDGAPLLADEQGSFSATLTFPHGTSILTFTATDRFGRKITKERTIYVPE